VKGRESKEKKVKLKKLEWTRVLIFKQRLIFD